MTPHFQSTMDRDILTGVVGVICKGWGNDKIVKGRTQGKLFGNGLLLLVRLLEKENFAAAHKRNVFTRSVTWCRKVSSSDGVVHLPAVLRDLATREGLSRGGGGGAHADYSGRKWVWTFLPPWGPA